MRVAAVVAVLLLAGSAAAQTNQSAKSRGPIANTPDQTIKGSAMAVEGDLLTVNGTAVRLMGIDAPDPGRSARTATATSWTASRLPPRCLPTW